STVSEHLRVLKDAGLIAGRVDGPRSCYELDRAAAAQLANIFGQFAAVLTANKQASNLSPTRKDKTSA
ncbi:MAG: ArsR/SmtB family transcription factor, partial [Beijerinckiaceae bacterium]